MENRIEDPQTTQGRQSPVRGASPKDERVSAELHRDDDEPVEDITGPVALVSQTAAKLKDIMEF